MNNIWIIAQSSGEETPQAITSEQPGQQPEAIIKVPDSNVPPTTQPPPRQPNYIQFLFLGLMFVMLYILFFRGPRKKQQQHKQMIQTLEKNDRVRTIGGIIGTVVDVKNDEITLKIDESTNTKIKIVPSAIGRNLTKENE